jgi:hypothetical protein
MKHLSDEALLALAEGGSEGRAHLETCGACRQQAEEFRAILTALRDEGVPEPPAGFWPEFSQRLRQVIDREARRGAIQNRAFAWWQPAALGALAAALVFAVWVNRTGTGPDGQTVSPGAAARDASVAAGSDVADAGDGVAEAGDLVSAAEESWAFVSDLAVDLEWEDADQAGFLFQPGSAQSAVDGLSQEERREFAAVLREALSKPEL